MSIRSAASPDSAFAVLLSGSVAAILAALAFQFIGGLEPCELCMWQRYAHGATIFFAALGFVASLTGNLPRRAAVVLLAATSLTLVVGALIGGFHVGVEQKWWAGTSACGVHFGPASDINDLRSRLLGTAVTRCDEVAWSMFGVSMAGWNALFSLMLGGLGLVSVCKYVDNKS